VFTTGPLFLIHSILCCHQRENILVYEDLYYGSNVPQHLSYHSWYEYLSYVLLSLSSLCE
jgi:hypothetical protein